MKKIFILLTLLFLSGQVVFAESMKCAAAMRAKKPFIVLYTSDTCTYCQRFKPIYSELYLSMNQKYNFVTINVAKMQYNGECDSVRVEGIPTVYIFNPKNGDKILVPHSLYYKTEYIENELDKYYASLNQ